MNLLLVRCFSCLVVLSVIFLVVVLYMCDTFILNMEIMISDRNVHTNDTHTSESNHPKGLDPDNWQIVVRNKIFVYSAHLDPESETHSKINILGSMHHEEFQRWRDKKVHLYCHLWIWTKDSEEPIAHSTKIKFIHRMSHVQFERRIIVYADLIMECLFETSPGIIDRAVVSITTNLTATPTVFMNLNQLFTKGYTYNYTVCTGRPMYGTPDPAWLVEWIETNLVLGADRIIVHNLNVTGDLLELMEYYVQKGVLEILPWHFPHSLDVTAQTQLQRTMVVDCQYRLQLNSRYTIMEDLDELIIPRHPDDMTWQDMIHRAGCAETTQSYVLLHVYYGLTYKDNINKQNTSLQIISNRQRAEVIMPFPVHSKYIAHSTPGIYTRTWRIHYVARKHNSDANTENCMVPVEIGGNHHYRNGGIFNKKVASVLDGTTDKYVDIVTERINIVMKQNSVIFSH